VYVETDFLVALVNDDDWLHDPAVAALEAHDDVHTSILAYAELLVLFYDRDEAEYEIDAPRAIANLLDLVPIVPEAHEQSVLAAAAFLEEYRVTPFDALHAGIVATRDERVLSTEEDYDTLGLDRVSLRPDEET
jgi:predicted nucleic acid-binding protein